MFNSTLKHRRALRVFTRRAVLPAFVAAAAQFQAPASAQTNGFALPAAGCPMAHCDSRMSDSVNAIIPTIGREVRVDKSTAGAKGGLGCVSNTSLVACTGGGDPVVQSNLVVYDADGNRVWDDRGILGATAWMSAAMISVDGNVIGADQKWVLRVDPVAKTVLWQSAKPDTGIPISPVLVGTDASMLLLATRSAGDGTAAELSVWDLASGTLLAHKALVDPTSGVAYATLNTPAVHGNRAYVLSAADGNSSDGRLYAIDICESPACGGRGAITPVWHYDFKGPSSSSPLRIGQRVFFDGLRSQGTGTFFAVDDFGSAPVRAWVRQFGGRFGASAAQDPRGGLWIYPWQTGSLLRLNEDSGNTVQTIAVSSVLGLAASYSPVTAVSVSASQTGAVVLTFGAQSNGQSNGVGPQVAAIDVSTTTTGTLLWKYKVSANTLINASTGQFPIVVNGFGARRVVFRGTNSSTFFVGEP